MNSIYFWPALESGHRELPRVLASGGHIVLAVRMQHPNASRLDPSRYGLTDADVDEVVKVLEAVGFRNVRVECNDGLDRQTMAAIVARRGGVPLRFVQHNQVVGYAYAQTRSDDLLRHPDAITLGPIGARAPEQAEACVYAAVDWARQRAAVARVAVTGPHPALGNLLEAGFRIGEVETFCTSDDASFVDPRRYISSGGDLF